MYLILTAAAAVAATLVWYVKLPDRRYRLGFFKLDVLGRDSHVDGGSRAGLHPGGRSGLRYVFQRIFYWGFVVVLAG